MNDIKDHSFLLLEEIPLAELSPGVAEIVGDYRYEGNINMNEAMDMIEECFKDEMLQWIQTNNELSEILSEEEPLIKEIFPEDEE
jgi:hypothetical protein